MADTLYLSLWYPNLRLAGLGDKLAGVLGQFAAHGGGARVYSATVWPIDWNESPIFQHIYGLGERGAEPRLAIDAALEMLHEDYAYEFQVEWSLWEVEYDGTAGPSTSVAAATFAQDDKSENNQDGKSEKNRDDSDLGQWVRQARLVRVTGYGPLFDEGAFEQDGHIRIDFGSDAAFLQEDADLSPQAARHVEENVRQLVELVGAVEKASGATARLLWSELGESLAQRLAARLGAVN